MATTADTTVEARGLAKRYGAVDALRDLSFTARAGEVLGLLGPNGAGKTTAIRLLTTILAPTRGDFAVAGIPHTRPTEIRRRIGVLPESAGYPEQQTGDEFLRYHAQLFGQSPASARARARDLLAEVGLAERGGSRIGAYSRGMRQRLGIARALVNDPAIVFLDEPTLGLDPAGQRQVLRLVQGMAGERGTTVVLSTHLLAEVEESCARVLILNRGRVIAQGTVDEVARRAGAPRRSRFRVPADLRDRALDALAGVPGVSDTQPLDSRPDWVAANGPVDVGRAVAALAEAGIPLLAYELEGARLSDAFLSMTESG
jgi:ABC-2 type transport system ATP-binding protein